MLTMMIVDDSNIIRRKIARLLELKGIKVVATAQDGIEAVDKFKKANPDLITMDITMPRMDGIAAVEAIIALNPEVRILIISALADKDTAIEAVRKGAQGFLTKPFSDDDLNTALLELIREE